MTDPNALPHNPLDDEDEGDDDFVPSEGEDHDDDGDEGEPEDDGPDADKTKGKAKKSNSSDNTVQKDTTTSTNTANTAVQPRVISTRSTPVAAPTKKRDLPIEQPAQLKKPKAAPANDKLGNLLSKLAGKKPSTISQSKQQWEQFKQKEGIEHELQQNRKDGFLQKVAFLERTDLRQFEKERELRLKNKKPTPTAPNW